MVQNMQLPKASAQPIRQRFALMLEGARKMGFLERKTESVTTRINPELLRLAKQTTGVEANSALIELAVANLIAEDGFPEGFARARGRVSPDLDLSV